MWSKKEIRIDVMADLKERLKVLDRATIIYKITVPNKLDGLMRLVVAIANSAGGYIILGIDNKEKIVGLNTDNKDNISKISDAIKNLTIGIEYSFTEMSEENKNILILDIKESDSTAFFCRSITSPHRQIAYELVKENGKNKVIKRCNMNYLNVYKYMSLDVFIISLYSRTWRFFEPSKWNDKFEQRFYIDPECTYIKKVYNAEQWAYLYVNAFNWTDDYRHFEPFNMDCKGSVSQWYSHFAKQLIKNAGLFLESLLKK